MSAEFCFIEVLFCFSATRDLEEKRSHFDGLSQADDTEGPSKFDEHDFVPHFQRVNISGEDTSGVSEA